MPLSSEEMRLALARGLGRALLHARAHGVERDRELVLAACLRNQTYDPQCEGSRADWMLEFLNEELAAEFLQRMDSPERFWDADQQARMAYLLARRGHDGARPALYKAFRPHPRTADMVAGEEILKLDGPQGLIELLRRLRETAATRLGQLVPILRDHYEDVYGNGSADPIIEEELVDWRPDEDRMVQSLSNIRPELTPSRPKLPEFEQIRRTIQEGTSCGFGLGYLGTLVSSEVADSVFELLTGLKQAPQLARGFEFFSQRGFPRITGLPIKSADHPSKSVRFFAIKAMARMADEQVRELALRCLRKGRWRASEVSLLRKNYVPGDEALLHPLLVADDHRLISDLRDLCEAHPNEKLLDVMMFVYESSTCLQCRGAVIEVMEDLKIFPEWAAEEHRYDALTFSSWN